MPEETEIQIVVQLPSSGKAARGEMDVRHQLEDAIEALGIGKIMDASSEMDITMLAVAVSDPEPAMAMLEALVMGMDIHDRTTFRVVRNPT